jgi:hypothetical protein
MVRSGSSRRQRRLSPQQESAMNEIWEQRVRANPMLFDGPMAAVTSVADDGRGRVEVSWRGLMDENDLPAARPEKDSRCASLGCRSRR